MTRINVYGRYTDASGWREEERPLQGHFDADKAEVFGEGIVWDASHAETVDEWLYRTAGGRWVRERDAHRCNDGPDEYWFVTPEEAREWLIKVGNHDAAIEKYFGALPDEEGPNLGGRPVEIADGQTFPVKFPRELVERVDAAAREAGLSRAGWLRHAAESYLTEGDPA